MDKSGLLPMGRMENLNDLVLELGCKVGVLSSSYLGLSLGAPFKFVAAWYEVERFCKRLVMLNRQYISKGGRVTLIRNTIFSMPIYFMSLMCILRLIRLRLV